MPAGSAGSGRLGRGSRDAVNGFAIAHQVQPIPCDEANVFGIVFEKIFLVLMPLQDESMVFNGSLEVFDAQIQFADLVVFGEEGNSEWEHSSEDDQNG